MSTLDLAVPKLKGEEGFRAKSYTDTEGHGTIGFGFNIGAGITPYAAEGLLRAQLEELDNALRAFAWYESLDEPRQVVLLDIAYNSGLAGLTQGFPLMIRAIEARDWTAAAAQCHVINPELVTRYAKNAQILLTGELS